MVMYRVTCDDCGADRVQRTPAHKCRPAAHPPGCEHCKRVRAVALDYRLAREAAELARELETCGYATETRQYGPLLTFRDWLQATADTTRYAAV